MVGADEWENGADDSALRGKWEKEKPEKKDAAQAASEFGPCPEDKESFYWMTLPL